MNTSINIQNEQRELDKIRFWLSRTTEEFDNWDYDGNELIIFFKDKIITERYSLLDIKDFIKDF